MPHPSFAEENTEAKLNARLHNLREDYKLEKLRGLSSGALEKKRSRLRARTALITERFPPGNGITGPRRGFAYGDSEEELEALSEDQFHRLLQVYVECDENIDKAITERRDQVQNRRWDRFRELVRLGALLFRNIQSFIRGPF